MCDNGIETVVVVVGRVIRYGFRHGFYGVLIVVSRKGRREREREGEGEKVETETEEVERIKLMTDVRVLTRMKKKEDD